MFQMGSDGKDPRWIGEVHLLHAYGNALDYELDVYQKRNPGTSFGIYQHKSADGYCGHQGCLSSIGCRSTDVGSAGCGWLLKLEHIEPVACYPGWS